MRRWVTPSEYHWAALLALLAVFATIAAWMSFGLINLAMANYDFLADYGLMAVREGGLWQLIGIGLRASVVLGSYLAFKAIETELVHRWRSAGR